MNVDAPRLLKTCRSGLDALGAAIREAIGHRDPRVPAELTLLLNRLDNRRRS